MWSNWKTYFRTAWALKTPFVLLLDRRYKLISADTAREICEALGTTYEEGYKPEVFDCDDYAWLYKAEGSRRQINGIGFAIGRYKGFWYCWNVILTPYGVRNVEPQNCAIFKKLRDYKVWAVII